MKSYVELHLRLLESYRVKRLLDILNNCKVKGINVNIKVRHQDRFVLKDVSDKFKRLTTICSDA